MQEVLATSKRPVNNSIALDQALGLLPVAPYIQQQLKLAFSHRTYLSLDRG